ncbi:porin [Paraburkholderia sediminicola]|uniref:porin n=1 Tax=Paraburkholderia sediminicola TaxID=458836 RepID=UPI000EB0195E
MKKVAVPVACGLLSAMSGFAHAQSSVTLYGLVDAGVSYTNNQRGSSVFQMTSGRLNGSRWGLRGIEDLGGGLQAVFTLENGFAVTNGALAQGGRLFGRQAFVGLEKTDIGTLTLGRQYDPIAELVAPLAGPGFWSPSTHIGDNDNFNTTYRVNNSLKFRSSRIAGFTVDTMYAFSNQAAGTAGQGFGNNRMLGVAANYAWNSLTVAGGYVRLDHPNSASATSGAIGGATNTTGDDYSGAFFYGLNGGVVRQQIATGGVSYKFGPAVAGFVFSHSQLKYVDGSSRKFSNYDVNIRYQLTPAVNLIGVYTFTDGRANNLPGTGGATLKPMWHQFSLGVDYTLSKRTDVYISGEYQVAVGDASTRVGNTYQNVAAIAYAAGPSTTNSQVAVFTGIRTKF